MKNVKELKEEITPVEQLHGSIDEAILQLSDIGYSVIIPDGLREKEIRKGRIVIRTTQEDSENMSGDHSLEVCVSTITNNLETAYHVSRCDSYNDTHHEVQLTCRAKNGSRSNSRLYSTEGIRRNGINVAKAGYWEY